LICDDLQYHFCISPQFNLEFHSSISPEYIIYNFIRLSLLNI